MKKNGLEKGEDGLIYHQGQSNSSTIGPPRTKSFNIC